MFGGREAIMLSLETRSKLVWFLPFPVSGLMACGSFIGMSSVSDAALQQGPAGDMAGAVGALLFLICIASGFVMATLTLIVAKFFRRGPTHLISVRLGLSFVGGTIIGVLGTKPDQLSVEAGWLLLLGLPVLVMWPSRLRVVPEAEKKIE